MNTPTRSPIVSDDLLARASKLHDAAFADPAVKSKPSWDQSVAAAQREASGKTAADQAEAAAAADLQRATEEKAAADAAEKAADAEAAADAPLDQPA